MPIQPRHVRCRTAAFSMLACILASVWCSGCSHNAPSRLSETTAPAAASDVRFADIAQQAGLNYRFSIPGTSPHTILDTIGNGCAFLDYNNDGNLDILLVGQNLALYQGDGHGHFTDVTHQTGLDKFHGHFLGCAVGDYDNDGYEDIYITAYGGGLLLHNEHGRYFKDVTAESGLKPQPWGTSAAFVDLDNDGKLDLYVGDYVDFGPHTQPQTCQYRNSVVDICGPIYYKPLRGELFKNLGSGKFENVTSQWNAQAVSGKTLGLAFADFDGSGRQSLALANDEVTGDLLKNVGGRFTDVAQPSGTAYEDDGSVYGGMGLDWGDYDNDGKLDLAVATYQNEPKCIFHNDGHDVFTDQSASLGVAAPTSPNVAFGVKWLDADNDGWLDLMIANGHVNTRAADVFPNESYQEATQFFYNRRGAHFDDDSAALTGQADRPIVGRGLAIGDFDNDGLMDALIVDSAGRPILLHNETPNPGHWLEVNLIGTKSNRDGIGALVTVKTADASLLRLCTTSGSYMSASDKRVHFGLAGDAVAQSIKVQWPSGHVDTYYNMNADRIITLREGDPRPANGW
jgi:enediyne biosynthesis protein E4